MTLNGILKQIVNLSYEELLSQAKKAKDILLQNKDFLENATAALIEKETLLYSDIKALRESVVKDVHF